VRDSLKVLFPHKADEIQELIDPGEYGLENYYVRIVCVFIFMMSVLSDLRSTIDMGYILWYVPTESQPWIEYKVPNFAPKEKVKEVFDKGEVDFVSFRIAGMPVHWKLINFIIIICPKIFIWKKTAKYGVMFLMETAGIENVIVNVTALTFILNLDEMLFQNFSHKALHVILDKLEPWQLVENESLEELSLQASFDAVVKDSGNGFSLLKIMPGRLLVTVFFTGLFIGEYYWYYCQLSERGGLVSRPQSLPKDQIFPVLAFLFPWVKEENEPTPYWKFPE